MDGAVLFQASWYVYHEPFALIRRRLISPWHRDNKLRPSVGGTGGSEIALLLSFNDNRDRDRYSSDVHEEGLRKATMKILVFLQISWKLWKSLLSRGGGIIDGASRNYSKIQFRSFVPFSRLSNQHRSSSIVGVGFDATLVFSRLRPFLTLAR